MGDLLSPTSGVQSPTKTMFRNATMNKLKTKNKKNNVHLESLLLIVHHLISHYLQNLEANSIRAYIL